MQIKELNPIRVLQFSTETSLQELEKYVRIKAHELYKEAAKCDLEVTGPVYWIYSGMNGNPTAKFHLDIAIPVHGNTYTGKFNLAQHDAFKCISAIHKGGWEKLAETYGLIFREIREKGIVPTSVCRELYIHMDFEDPSNNITEIQVGIH